MPWYDRPSKAALTSALAPVKVTVTVPSAPASIVRLVVDASVNVPCETVNLTVRSVASTSATEIELEFAALKTKAVSSFTFCAPGTVLTGASLRPLTITKISVVVSGVVACVMTKLSSAVSL